MYWRLVQAAPLDAMKLPDGKSPARCRHSTRLHCSHLHCCGGELHWHLLKSIVSQLSVLTQNLVIQESMASCSPCPTPAGHSLPQFSSVAFSTTGPPYAFLPSCPTRLSTPGRQDITKLTAKHGGCQRAWGKRPSLCRQSPKTRNQPGQFRWLGNGLQGMKQARRWCVTTREREVLILVTREGRSLRR